MAWVAEISIDTAPELGDDVRLHEPMAHVFLGFDGDERMEGWYLDTNTTSHMTESDCAHHHASTVEGA
jgi:hypothetical protein